MAVAHSIFIALHAALGGVAFFAGLVAIGNGRLFWPFLVALVGTIVALVGAVIAGWSGYGTVERVLFAALTALGGYMVLRGAQAVWVRPVGARGVSHTYVSHVGFNLVALFDAFVVVLVLDLGGSGWLIAAVGVAIAIVGHFVLTTAERRVAQT